MRARSPTSSPDGLPFTFSATRLKLQAYVTSVVILFSSRIVRCRADTGGEYTSTACQACCFETGIKQLIAATNTAQQIDGCERVGWTTFAMVRCLLIYRVLPPNLYGERIRIVLIVYLRNRIPHSALRMEMPHKFSTAKTLTYLPSRSSGPGSSFTSRIELNLSTHPGKG